MSNTIDSKRFSPFHCRWTYCNCETTASTRYQCERGQLWMHCSNSIYVKISWRIAWMATVSVAYSPFAIWIWIQMGFRWCHATVCRCCQRCNFCIWKIIISQKLERERLVNCPLCLSWIWKIIKYGILGESIVIAEHLKWILVWILLLFCSSRAFDGLLQLLKLDISANEIRQIPIDAFTGLVSLRRLDLSFNHLKKLDNKTRGVLDDCLSLESVNIHRSQHRIDYISPPISHYFSSFFLCRQINLSHNKFSFVTSKTFPSSPWVPYRLREIDLSYNEMPVLTYDLAFGTAKVKTLNISHNVINEIRRSECIEIWLRQLYGNFFYSIFVCALQTFFRIWNKWKHWICLTTNWKI